MIQPDFKTFCKLARQGNLVPVYDTFTADMLTPVSAYLRLAQDARYACLLESVEGGEKIARYTFVGANPARSIPLRQRRVRAGKREPHLLGAVESARLPAQSRGAVSPRARAGPAAAGGGRDRLFRVRHGAACSSAFPTPTRDDVGMDDAVMMFYLGLVVFDHVRHRVWIVRNVFTDGEGSLRAKYNPAVREIRATRRRLDAPRRRGASQAPQAAPAARSRPISRAPNFWPRCANPRNTFARATFSRWPSASGFAAKTDADPFEIYRALRVVNPSPYMYFLKLGDLAVVGSSPEMLVKVQGRDAFYRPIAGTRPRGADEKEDAAPRSRTRRRSQGARRAHHAGGSGPQRSGPRLGVRLGARREADVRRALLARDASGFEPARAAARRTWIASTRWRPAFPAARFPARRKFAPWKSSTNSSPRAAESTAGRFCISISRGISIPASRFAPWS